MGNLNSQIEQSNKVTLPARVLQELDLKEGNDVEFRVESGSVRIIPSVHERVRRVQEKMKKHVKLGRSVVDEFLAERRAEAEKE